MIYNPTESNSSVNVDHLRSKAEELGFELLERPVPLDRAGRPIPERLPELIESLAGKIDFLYMGPDSFLAGANRDITTYNALHHEIPTFSATEGSVRRSNAMIGLVSGYYSVGQFTAFKAEQILVQKIPPEDIPIETLKRFSFIVNMKVAKRMELYPPITVLQFAEAINVSTEIINADEEE